MPLTKQQLLIPRVLCIGTKEGEPNDTSGDFITGDILTQTVKSIHKWRSEKLKHSVYLDPDFVEKFLHLFKPLQWWEHRKPEDMPEYLKLDIGYVKEVESYSSTEGLDYVYFQNDHCSYPLYMTIPATFKEYQEYKKQKEAK